MLVIFHSICNYNIIFVAVIIRDNFNSSQYMFKCAYMKYQLINKVSLFINELILNDNKYWFLYMSVTYRLPLRCSFPLQVFWKKTLTFKHCCIVNMSRCTGFISIYIFNTYCLALLNTLLLVLIHIVFVNIP